MQTSDWIALSSATIALCVFFTSLWQARKSHLHSLVSVKPVLDLPSKTDNFPDINQIEVSFNLSNNGLGPAHIKAYKCFIDNEEVDLKSLPFDQNAVQTVLQHLKLPSYIIKSSTDYKENTVIKAGTENCILKIRSTLSESDLLKKELQRISMFIEYEDFFGNAQPPLDQRERD
jgi:hypothetical protein